MKLQKCSYLQYTLQLFSQLCNDFVNNYFFRKIFVVRKGLHSINLYKKSTSVLYSSKLVQTARKSYAEILHVYSAINGWTIREEVLMTLSLRLEGVVCFFAVLRISFIVRSCIPNMKGWKTLIHVVTSGCVYNISIDMRYKLHFLPIQCTGFSQLSARIIFTVLMRYHHK